MTRRLLLAALLVAAAATLHLIERPARARANGPGPDTIRVPADANAARPDTIPPQAVEALRQGRFLRASLILREYLDTSADSTPPAVLLAAEAEAGWGDWEMVERLLAGRSWLDSTGGGRGWYLLGSSQLDLGQYEESGRSLARYLAVAEDLAEHDRAAAELRLAAALRGAERYDDALAAYDRAQALLPLVEDWIAIRAAGAAADAGDTAAVARRLATVDAELARDWGEPLRLRAYTAAGDRPGALAVAEAAGENAALAANRRGEALVTAADIRLQSGDTLRARAVLLRALALAPGGAGIDAARKLSELRGVSASDRLRIGRVYLRHGNIERGVAGLTAYLEAGAGSAGERRAVRAELGRALFNAGRYADAEKVLLRVADEATGRASAAAALFLAGRAQYRDGRQALARRTFLRVVERYGDTDAAARALYLSADLDHDDGELERAAARYRRTIAMASDVEEVGLAHMRLAALAFVAGEYADAFERYDAYRRRYPQGRRHQQASYWSALALDRMGRDAEARQRLDETWRWDPLSYYGGRAAELLGRTFADTPLSPSPRPDAEQERRVARALAGVDRLRELGWMDAAVYELGRARASLSDADRASYALAEALNARGFTTAGITVGWEIRRAESGWNPRLLRIVYPFPYREVIEAEAAEQGVDPYLAAALIRQESMFNPRAVSGAGAIGLMQVMPATGRVLAGSLRMRRFSPVLLEQADVNAHLGMVHLAEQLRTYDGRLPVVLAAYNAGSGRIDRWREFPEFDDDELFSERIPFGETRDYVKIVQNNARIYAALYGATALE